MVGLYKVFDILSTTCCSRFNFDRSLKCCKWQKSSDFTDFLWDLKLNYTKSVNFDIQTGRKKSSLFTKALHFIYCSIGTSAFPTYLYNANKRISFLFFFTWTYDPSHVQLWIYNKVSWVFRIKYTQCRTVTVHGYIHVYMHTSNHVYVAT